MGPLPGQRPHCPSLTVSVRFAVRGPKPQVTTLKASKAASLSALLAAFLYAAVTGPASAGLAGDPSTAEPRNCVIGIEPLREGETYSRVINYLCYDTLAEADAAVALGWALVPPGEDVLSSRSFCIDDCTHGAITLGRDYEHENFGGAVLTWQSQTGCLNGNKYYNSMPSGWNDKVDSSKTNAAVSCRHTKNWEHEARQGASVICDTDYGIEGVGCKDVGDAMHDRTSSKEWYS